jgi:glycerophosphoryl diester phosphodiesterase
MKPLIIAHRGDTVNCDENNLAAFKSAFERGADGIELDVQFFQNELIVVHDYLFDREKTYPLLKKVLQEFSRNGRLEIEIKCMETDFIAPLTRLVSMYPTADIELTTSVLPIVPFMRSALPGVRMGIILHSFHFEDWMTREFVIEKILSMMSLLKGQVAHIPIHVLGPDVVKACHAAGLKVHAHLRKESGELENYRKLVEWGVDQCTVDNIVLASRPS